MPKLKSLRGAIGSYGRVAAGGIVEVGEAHAKKLLATKRFVAATQEDIAKAKAAQEAALAVQTTGAAPGFSPMPEKPKAVDRLQEMVERGDLTPSEARKLAGLQISVSTEEVQALIQREADEVTAQIDAAKADLEARKDELDTREANLKEREAAIEAREKALPIAKDKDAGSDTPASPAADAADKASTAADKKSAK